MASDKEKSEKINKTLEPLSKDGSCADCKFYIIEEQRMGVSQGSCFRFPPGVVLGMGQQGPVFLSKFPVVKSVDYCGEFTKKPNITH